MDNWGQSLVFFANSKLAELLFVINSVHHFNGQNSRPSHGVEGYLFGDLRSGPLLLADDAILLASSVCDL